MNRTMLREIGVGVLLYLAMTALMALCAGIYIFGAPAIFNGLRAIAFIRNTMSPEVFMGALLALGMVMAVAVPLVLFRLLLVRLKKTYAKTSFTTLYVCILLPEILMLLFGNIDILGFASTLIAFLTIYYWIQPVVIKKESI